MIVFPNAKINIGLDIIEKRPDGFHAISTIFYPVKIYDALEILRHDGEGLQFGISGNESLSATEDNLCVKACRLLEPRYGLPVVNMHLHNNIPTGAGLGGGSADAAFPLRLLNDLAGLKLDSEELEICARQLGSDCAFFIRNKPVYAFERGDEVRPLELDLSGYYLVVIMPDYPVSTAQAYAHVTPRMPDHPLEELCKKPVETWKSTVKNNFEP